MKKKHKFDILDALELIGGIGFGFFIIILGTWALPQMRPDIQTYFAPCILLAAIYVVYNVLDKLGVMRDTEEED